MELSAYVHLNPVRGGLVKKPHHYPWSSYRFYFRDEKEMFVDGDLGKELAKLPFKATAEHFNRDPVVISKGTEGLEKRIREDEEIAATITTLRVSLTKSRDPILI